MLFILMDFPYLAGEIAMTKVVFYTNNLDKADVNLLAQVGIFVRTCWTHCCANPKSFCRLAA